MKYVDKLLQETDFLEQLEKLEQLEQDRSFCRHGLEHLLDTARIAWIRVLEQQEESEWRKGSEQQNRKRPDQEMVYLSALLHDLGRIQEYEDGTPHHKAGVVKARLLLEQVGYPKEKTEQILMAIQEHRTLQREKVSAASDPDAPESQSESWLGELLRWADKKSRNCFYCKAAAECNWAQEKKNRTIGY